MEPPYVYHLPAGSHIYRATTVSNVGRWYNLSLEDAYTYGETITEYATKKDLKLINAMSLTFHLDFIDRLNVLYPGEANSGFDTDKLKCLIPFGLVDLKSQKELLSVLGFNVPVNTQNWDRVLDILSSNILDRHRLSEHSLDTHMSSVMEKIYGNYFDGFISPVRWPTKMHGHLFPRELHIFVVDNLLEEINISKRPTGHAGGGSIEKIKIPTMAEMDASFKKHEEKLLQSLKDYKFVPLWNKHTEDVIPTTRLSIKPVNKTRKRKN